MSTTESLFSFVGSEPDIDGDGPSSPSPESRRKIVVVGAGPVGALAAIYAAERGYDVEIYELRDGKDMGKRGL